MSGLSGRDRDNARPSTPPLTNSSTFNSCSPVVVRKRAKGGATNTPRIAKGAGSVHNPISGFIVTGLTCDGALLSEPELFVVTFHCARNCTFRCASKRRLQAHRNRCCRYSSSATSVRETFSEMWCC